MSCLQASFKVNSENHPRIRHSGLPFVMFLAWLVWIPLPVGSNRPIWLAVSMAWVCAIFAVILVKWMRRRFHIPRAFRTARLAWVILTVFLAWQLLQLFAPAWMIPEFLRDAYIAAGTQAPGITLDRFAGYETLVVTLLVYSAFILTLMLVDSLHRVHLLLWTLVWVGLVLSVTTGISAMEGRDLDILGINFSRRGNASGSFVNRNHFANYLVMTLAAGIGLLISMQDRRYALSWRERLQSWIETLMGPKARLRIFLALTVITLVLTRSRMGNTAFFASLLITGGLVLVLIRGRQRPLFILIASLVIIDLFIVGTWFGVGQVVDRIQKTVTVTETEVVINEQDRLDANRETLKMLKQAPVTGIGGGSYFSRFPQFRSPDQRFFDHAHNDYLEFSVNYGVPAMLLWGVFIVLSMAKALSQIRVRNHALAIGACFASFMSVVAMGIHSLVDFSLQIPANAVTFMIMLALPWAVSVKYDLSQ